MATVATGVLCPFNRYVLWCAGVIMVRVKTAYRMDPVRVETRTLMADSLRRLLGPRVCFGPKSYKKTSKKTKTSKCDVPMPLTTLQTTTELVDVQESDKDTEHVQLLEAVDTRDVVELSTEVVETTVIVEHSEQVGM